LKVFYNNYDFKLDSSKIIILVNLFSEMPVKKPKSQVAVVKKANEIVSNKSSLIKTIILVSILIKILLIPT
jgi:hypothetical protein